MRCLRLYKAGPSSLLVVVAQSNCTPAKRANKKTIILDASPKLMICPYEELNYCSKYIALTSLLNVVAATLLGSKHQISHNSSVKSSKPPEILSGGT